MKKDTLDDQRESILITGDVGQAALMKLNNTSES